MARTLLTRRSTSAGRSSPPDDAEAPMAPYVRAMPRFAPVAVLLAAVALAAGCGSDDGSETSATEEWASSVCTAFSTWRDALTSATSSLTGDISEDALS